MLVRLGRTFGLYRSGQQTAFESLEGRSIRGQRRGTRMFHVLALLAIAGVVVLVLRRKRTVWPPWR